MFVQVIQGRVVDPGQVHAAHDRWVEEVAPGADRWLGTTAGVSGDADFIGLVRFESEEAARRNDSRPELPVNVELVAQLAGILRGLRADYQAGYMRTVEELIHTIHAHPTMSEAVGEAAHATHGAAIHI